jgi:hypothetical protein
VPGRSVIRWGLLAGACAGALALGGSTAIAQPASQPPPVIPPPALDGFQNIPITPSGPDNILARPPAPPGPPRVLMLAPRTGKRFEMEYLSDQKALLVTGGVILTISNVEHIGIVDIEADNVVIWTKGDAQAFMQNLQSGQGGESREDEFFMNGNVVMRSGQGKDERVLRADELYYDVRRNVAVAISADLEFRDPQLPDPIHFRADELYQLGRQNGSEEFKAIRAEVFSSKLPSDPGLKVFMGVARLSQRTVPRVSILGRPFYNPETGQEETIIERTFQGENVQLRLANIPVFFTGFVQGTMTDPTGPIRGVTFRHDNIFGYHIGAEFDLLNLLGIIPPAGSRWILGVDEFTNRGPGLGTTLDYGGDEFLGFNGHNAGTIKLYGLYDKGVDILGGPRTGEPHPAWRGRLFMRHIQDLPDGWQFMGQLSLLSDKNFLEQYYKPEFDLETSQESFVYLNKHAEFLGGSLLVEPRMRSWVTETAWLPRAEGQVVGWSPLDLLTYNARTSVGFAELKTPGQPPPPVQATDVATNLGRFDFWQDLALPFNVGPFKIVPFATMDVAAYTDGVDGNGHGRFYVGGGARASLPFSRLYPDARSDLFNVEGIYHKSVLSGMYYGAWSSTPYSVLPQLDRLNDDATDQSLRDITPLQPAINPQNGAALATSPIFNPQLYAIRRLVDNRADTLDSIQVFELDLRQRWQTKRGFPGLQHTVDLLTVDVSMSLFPNPDKDNFGSSVGFIEYDATWNVGDRTSVVSSGWFDPFNVGTRYATLGMNLNRPDGTLFSVGFRYVDPIDSRLITAAASYTFSPKYQVTASTAYDFGANHGLYNSLTFTRTGTDLQLSMGITYNPILNNFGFSISLLPILIAHQRPSSAAPSSFGPGRGF